MKVSKMSGVSVISTGISVGIGSVRVVGISLSSGSSLSISGPLAPVVGNGVAVGTVGISVGIGSVRVVGISLSSGSSLSISGPLAVVMGIAVDGITISVVGSMA